MTIREKLQISEAWTVFGVLRCPRQLNSCCKQLRGEVVGL